MKIVDKPLRKDRNSFGFSGVMLGLLILALVGYCIVISDAQCIRYYGRRGLVEDCSSQKLSGLFALGSMAFIGIMFLVVGTRNILTNFIRKKGNLRRK